MSNVETIEKEKPPGRTAEPPKRKKKGAIRENVESIGIAILLALVIRTFIVEAFKIPTGSMAPTLLGRHKNITCPNCGWKFALDWARDYAECLNCRYPIQASKLRAHGGYRILVSKFWYKFTSLNRWDVVVFLYPQVTLRCRSCGHNEELLWKDSLTCPSCRKTLKREGWIPWGGRMTLNGLRYLVGASWKDPEVEEKNFIKRLVGLPGDKLRIRDGDLYVDGRIERKPKHIQDTLWQPVYDSAYVEKESVSQTWSNESAEGWSFGKDGIAFTSEKSSRLAFRRVLRDRYGYNGDRDGHSEVGDLKVDMTVKLLKDTGEVGAVLERDNDRFAFVIGAKESGKPARLERNEKPIASSPQATLTAGKEHRIEFSNVDQRVEVRLDGKELFTHDYEPSATPRTGLEARSRLELTAGAADALFSRVRIFRDIYYTDFGSGPHATSGEVQLGPGEYFVLGDNSPNSKDSRVWRAVPEKNFVGKAFFVFWPLTRLKVIR